MDPLSGALLAFGAIKKGISMGKELHSMSKDLNNLFSFIDGAKEAQKSGKKGDPLSDYIAYEKAMDYEKQLMQLIWETRGSKGVAKFNEFRKQAKKREVEGKYLATKRKNQILNAAGIFFAMLITGAGGYFMIWFAMQYK
jgi:hypothetical protein